MKLVLKLVHQDYDPYDHYPRASGSKKWKNILGPIWNEFQFTGIVSDSSSDDGASVGMEMGDGMKMYLQKNGRCFDLSKTAHGGINLLPRPKLAGVRGDGLYLRHGSDIFHGEGLLLGKKSPFRNIPVLGWLL